MKTDIFPSDMNAFLNFPWQNYFMNIGPWMSHEMYVVQGSAVLATGFIFYFVFIKSSAAGKEFY